MESVLYSLSLSEQRKRKSGFRMRTLFLRKEVRTNRVKSDHYCFISGISPFNPNAINLIKLTVSPEIRGDPFRINVFNNSP